jgi:hypothetical protein
MNKQIQQIISDTVPGIIAKCLETSLVPFVVKQLKQIDSNIKEDVLPILEKQIESTFERLMQKGMIGSSVSGEREQ